MLIIGGVQYRREYRRAINFGWQDATREVDSKRHCYYFKARGSACRAEAFESSST